MSKELNLKYYGLFLFMSDLTPAELLCALSDLGVDIHLLDGHSQNDDTDFFSDTASQDILHKIQTKGADISERDAVSGHFKHFIPSHFRPQPHNQKLQPIKNIQPIRSSQQTANIKGQKPYKRIAQQQPSAVSSGQIDVKRPIDDALKKVEALCKNLHSVQDIIQAVSDYKSDTEWQRLASSPVFFDGDENADILFIGDMPSKEDEQFQKPLSSDADEIMMQTLKYALPDHNMKIAKANLLFWRSLNPNSHSHYYPLCVPFMQRLIHVMQPKKIILLGVLPASLLTGAKGTMMSLRGTSQEIKIDSQNYPAFVTFHPNYLLRVPIAKKFFWQDLLKYFSNQE